MKLNRLAIISLTAAIIFVLPLFAVAQNGKPFQALQEQIDDLQQQLEAVQTGPVKAYVTKNGAIDLTPNIDHSVMTLTLPEGKYIYTITIQASYYPNDLYNPLSQTFLECSFLYDNEPSGLGHHVGGGVNGTDTHALTTEDEITPMFGDEVEVTLVCEHEPFDTGETMTINSAVWTAIKVGEIDRQNIE